jgi:hypothetical protein
MKTKIEINCCICVTKHETEIDLPDGWKIQYDSIDVDKGFCPKHSKIYDFVDSQCPGCVEGWKDCSFWHKFAYNKHDLTKRDFQIIESGFCPVRTNGTLVFSEKGKENIDLSEKATNEAGKCLADAIREYWDRYPLENIIIFNYVKMDGE